MSSSSEKRSRVHLEIPIKMSSVEKYEMTMHEDLETRLSRLTIISCIGYPNCRAFRKETLKLHNRRKKDENMPKMHINIEWK